MLQSVANEDNNAAMVVIKEEDEQNKEENAPLQPIEYKEQPDNNKDIIEGNEDKEKVPEGTAAPAI